MTGRRCAHVYGRWHLPAYLRTVEQRLAGSWRRECVYCGAVQFAAEQMP